MEFQCGLYIHCPIAYLLQHLWSLEVMGSWWILKLKRLIIFYLNPILSSATWSLCLGTVPQFPLWKSFAISKLVIFLILLWLFWGTFFELALPISTIAFLVYIDLMFIIFVALKLKPAWFYNWRWWVMRVLLYWRGLLDVEHAVLQCIRFPALFF